MGNLPAPPRHESAMRGPGQTGRKPVKVQRDDGTRMVKVRSTRRRWGQRTTKTQARPFCQSRRPQLRAQRARARRAVTRRSGSGNARSTTRHTTSSGRRRPSSLVFQKRKGIGSHPTTRREDRRGKCSPCHTTSVRRSHRQTRDDGAYWNRRPPTHIAVDRTNQVQQWQRKEAQLFEQELTPQHYQ